MNDGAAPRRDLAGLSFLVTAGPTQEPLDPVRYLGNRSSGKMGFAIAERAAARGATVTLVAGPVALPTPPGCARVNVKTALELEAAVMSREAEASCVVMAAAVADFRPAEAAGDKIKKTETGALTLHLVPNPDVLAGLGARRRARGGGAPFLVGFAAETSQMEARAAEKLARKGCDLLVGNDVAEAGSGFGSDTNRVVLFAAGSAPLALPLLPKSAVADRLLDRIASALGRA